MPTATSIQRGMASVGGNATGSTTAATATTSTSVPEARPTLSEREQLKIEFYKTYDVMTGIRIAATLGGFFSLMVLLVVYKSRCKSNRQLQDPRLTAAAEAAVAEAEAEERALAAALEAIARLPPKPARGPRRSLCVEPFRSQYTETRLPLVAPRFASVGGGYDSLLAAPMRRGVGGSSRRLRANRRCSSVTCSSTASSYLERRGSAMVMPCLPPPPSFPRHGAAYDEPWDLYHPIDIQVIQPTPELSPCGSEAGLYGAAAAALRQQRQQQRQQQQYRHSSSYSSSNGAQPGASRRAPLASMGSVDPPEPDSRSLGSDSVFLDEAARRAAAAAAATPPPPDTEDEVSGFSTDSSDGPVLTVQQLAGGAGGRRSFLKVPPKKKRPPERWDGCAGCVPRRRRATAAACQTCMTISASVEAPRSPVLSTTTSSSQNSVGLGGGLISPPCSTSSPIELRHRPSSGPSGTSTARQQATARPSSSPPVWSQETLF